MEHLGSNKRSVREPLQPQGGHFEQAPHSSLETGPDWRRQEKITEDQSPGSFPQRGEEVSNSINLVGSPTIPICEDWNRRRHCARDCQRIALSEACCIGVFFGMMLQSAVCIEKSFRLRCDRKLR